MAEARHEIMGVSFFKLSDIKVNLYVNWNNAIEKNIFIKKDRNS